MYDGVCRDRNSGAYRRLFITSSLALCALFLPSVARSQSTISTESDAKSGEAGEIIVTALKRSQSLQKTAAAITVVQADALEIRQLNTISDLATTIPNLVFSTQYGISQIAIRGIAPDGTVPALDPSVAQHIDGVYQPRVTNMNVALADVESVEVLRGPQGTLYGRNATAGVINFILKKPADTLEVGATALYGNYDRKQLKAYLSGPISESISARISALYDKRDGYGLNLFTGKRYDDQDTKGIRAALRIRPSTSVLIDLSAYYSLDKTVGPQVELFTPITGPRLAPFQPLPFTLKPHRVYDFIDPRNRNRQISLTGAVSVDLASGITLKSLTGYQDNDLRQEYDTVPAPVPYGHSYYDIRSKAFSQEFNLNVSIGDRIDAVLGLYYAQEKLTNLSRLDLVLGLVPAVSSVPASLAGDLLQTSRTKAVFGDVTFHATDSLRFVGGLRYNRDTKDVLQRVGLEPTTACNFAPASVSYNATTGKIGAQYDFAPRVMGYVQYQTGFKAGGFNASVCGDDFDPENIKSYEAGIKATTQDRSLTVNLAVFDSKFSNLQVSTIVPINNVPQARVENAAAARIRGVEAEVTLRPTEQLRANINFTYLDAHYSAFESINSNAINPADRVLVDLAGFQVSKAPKTTVSVGLEYDVDLAGAKITPRGEIFTSSALFYDPFHNSELRQSSYTIVNGFLTVTPSAGPFRFSIYAKNITNTAYKTGGNISGNVGNARGFYNDPRTFGAQVDVKF